MNPIIQDIKQKFRSGQQLEAISECEQACLGHPNDADLKKLAALMLSITGNNQRAKVFLEAAQKLSPDDLDIIFNLGLCCKLISEYENSIHWFGLYIQEKQQDSEAWVNIVDCYIQKKQFDKALQYIRNASDSGVLSEQLTHLNANALEGLKRYEEAIAKYEQVLSANPNFYVAWSNKGAALQKIRQFDSAMQSFDEAIRLKPDYPYVFLNKGFLLLELGFENESIVYFEKAIHLKPDFEEAWFNKGISYTNLKNYPKALDAYKRALDLRPQLNYLLGLFIGVKKQICDWQDYDQLTLKLYQEIELSHRVASPFCMLSITDSLDINFKGAKIDANNKYSVRTNFVSSPSPNRVKKNRIRVGYYSPDFKDHPVAYLISGIFNHYDKSQFEVIGFSLNQIKNSAIYQQFENTIDQMIDVSMMSDSEVVSLSREMQIDIAIDLTGYTQDGRFNIFVKGVAPIQIAYLGFLGTMGHECLDYLIAEATIIPSEFLQFYTEKIIYLPSYHVNDPANLKSDCVYTRQELGLPDHGFVYCCFNNNYKITPDVFSSWMRILKAVEDSVFWIYVENDWVKANLTMEAQKRGIAATRIIFAKKVSRVEYLARFEVGDLFLDTAPYNAGTTASDALYAGLPVLTRIGSTFSGRMAASILTTMELPELITQSSEEYEELAITLATNPVRLRQVREKLSHNRSTSILYKPDVFTKNLERAYQAVYERYSQGLKPAHIEHNAGSIS